MRTEMYAFTLLLIGAAADPAVYAKPEMLLEPAALAREASAYVILDARPKAAYQAAHIPGAHWIDAADWAKAFGAGDDVVGWSRRIALLGIAKKSKVVIYDDVRSKDAARV